MTTTPSTGDQPEVPDFSKWATHRLQMLHADYKDSLQSISILYGRSHPEYHLYKTWVDAIKEELDKRNASRLG